MRFCRASQEEEEKERAEWQWETEPGFVVVFAAKQQPGCQILSNLFSNNNPFI